MAKVDPKKRSAGQNRPPANPSAVNNHDTTIAAAVANTNEDPVGTSKQVSREPAPIDPATTADHHDEAPTITHNPQNAEYSKWIHSNYVLQPLDEFFIGKAHDKNQALTKDRKKLTKGHIHGVNVVAGYYAQDDRLFVAGYMGLRHEMDLLLLFRGKYHHTHNVRFG